MTHRFATVVALLVSVGGTAWAEKHITFKKPPAPAAANNAGVAPTPNPPPSPPKPLPPYWIGVNIRPADSTLRNHLHLGDAGLIVQAVAEGTPAQTAGIKADDVLVEATAKDAKTSLRQLDDLIKAVNAAGSSPVKIRLIREGKEQTITATPAKRAAAVE